MNKKKSLILGLFFAFAILFGFGATPSTKTVSHAITHVEVTFMSPGATPEISQQTTNAEGKLSSLPTPTLAEHVFVGWYKTGELITTDTVFEENTNVEAHWARKIYSFTLIPNAGSIDIVGKTETNGITYSLSATDLEDAFDQIENDIPSLETPITLTFSNYSTAETIELPYKNVTVSGRIANNSTAPVFEITSTAENTSVNFDDLYIISNSAQILIDATNLPTGTTITLTDCDFNSSANNSYALDLFGENTTLNIRGSIKSSCTYLFDFFEGLTFDLSEKLTNTEMVYASVGIEFNNTVLSRNFNPENLLKFSCKPKSAAYKFKHYHNSPVYMALTFINFEFDDDDIIVNTNYTWPDFSYNPGTKINFPNESQLSQTYATFDGWFGKITLTDNQKTTLGLDQNDWFFDKLALQVFAAESFDLTKLSTIFKRDTSSFSTENAFTCYEYDELGENPNYLPVELGLSLNTSIEFVSRWDKFEFTITFDSNGGTEVAPLIKHFGDAISAPAEIPTLLGHSFVGWYDETLKNKYTFTTMPNTNFTLYAKWIIESFTVTFVTNIETTASPYTNLFNKEISFPTNLSKTGHKITGWYLDENFTEQYTSTKIPGNNITLYAKWEKETYYIQITPSNYDLPRPSTTIIPKQYGDTLEKPAQPSLEGYKFVGYYLTDRITPFLFDITMPDHNINIIEMWETKKFKLTAYFNNGTSDFERNYDYGSEIQPSHIPTPSKTSFYFNGWFIDENFTTTFNFNNATMPAADIKLYAKWTEKLNVVLVLPKQSFEEQNAKPIELDTTLTGVVIEYKVNGKWTKTAPTAVGTYDIKLSRIEDNTYKSYSQVFEGVYTITPNTINLDWLVYLLFSIFVIEMLAIIIIRRVKSTKQTQNLTFAVALPFGLIPTTQFVLLVVSGVLALFGFVLVVLELVKLHRAVPTLEEKTGYNAKDNVENAQKATDNRKIESNVDNLLKQNGFIKERETGTSFYDSSENEVVSNNANLIDEADNIYHSKNNNNSEE